MHQRNRTILVLIGLGLAGWLIGAWHAAHAANWVCARDLNGDGEFATAGETASCIVESNNTTFCPVGATPEACRTERVITLKPFSPATLTQVCPAGTLAHTQSFSFGTALTLRFSCGPAPDRFTVELIAAQGRLSLAVPATPHTGSLSFPGQIDIGGGDWIRAWQNGTAQGCDGNARCQYSFHLYWRRKGGSDQQTDIGVSFQAVAPANACSVEETFNDTCAAVAARPECLLRTETVDGVETVRNSQPTGATVPASTRTFTLGSCRVDLTRPWWTKEQDWLCEPANAVGGNCVDLDATPAVTTTQDPTLFVDDGQRDASGVCLDTIYLFNGRRMRCNKAGVKTGFTNCCEDTNTVFTDSMGSASALLANGKALKTAAELTQVAVTGYLTGGAAGVQASIGNYLAATATPMGVAAAAAIAVATHFLSQGCDDTDTETAMLKSSGYCTYIGQYCSEDWPGVGCVQKTRSYCCFSTKLARIIHEQGRQQLVGFNAGWGDPKHPNCRGFTPEEFQALDFGAIDLSEYYGDLQTRAQPQIQTNLENKVNDFYNNISP